MQATKRLRYFAGPATALGGALWVGCAVVTASRPPGIPGGEYRHTDDLVPYLLASMALFAVGMAALYVRRTDRSGRLSPVGLVAGFAGLTALVAGSTAQLIGNLDLSLTPWFLLPGGLFFMAGVVLTAIAALRDAVLPRWAGGLLIGAVLLMPLFNTEDDRAWFAVPFGLAWIVVGFVPAFARRAGLHRATRLAA